MKFVDFDTGLQAGYWPQPFLRERNLRYRAFVRAIRIGLARHRFEAPWRKLYLTWVSNETDHWQAPIPSVGISAAGFVVPIPDDELLTADGEAIRPVLARNVTRVRDRLRSVSGWDDEHFWQVVTDTGNHHGRYSMPSSRLTSTDRQSKVTAAVTYEWDEAGTIVYADARVWPVPEAVLWRVQLADLPGVWEPEFAAEFAPTKLRLSGSAIEALDRNGNTIAEADRPDRV